MRIDIINIILLTVHCRKLVLEELFANRVRLSRRAPSRLPHTRTRTNTNRSVHSLQRRHAPPASEPVRLFAPQFSSLGGRGSPPDSLNASASTPALPEAAERFKRLSQLELEQLNLDEAWNAYLAAVESNALSVITSCDLLELMDKMIRIVEQQRVSDLDVDAVHGWGESLSGALQAMESPLASSSPRNRRRHCLLARCASMLDDSDRALELLRSAQEIPAPSKDFDSAHAYEAIALAIHRSRDAAHVLDFLVAEWKFIGPLLYDIKSRGRLKNPAGGSFRLTLHHILASVKRPLELLSEKKDWPRAQLEKRGHILIELFCEMRRPVPALDVYHTIQAQKLNVPLELEYCLVAALTRADAFRVANKLYESLPTRTSKPSRSHLIIGLQLYAQQGDHIRAKQCFDGLADHGWDDHSAKATYVSAHAVQGDMNKALELFDHFYPEGADGSRLNTPTRFVYSVMIHGFSRRGDLKQINEWLHLMSKAGYQADVYIFGAIIYSFGLRNDMTSIAAVLSQMRAAGLMPNVVIYNTIMSVLARRGDVDGAEAIFKRTIRERIIPDGHMVTTLMNAHIEAGSWEGVIRVFNRFKAAFSDQTLGLGTESYNTLLKAYVKIGAPYRLVLRLFNKIRSFRIEPDAYTYSILLQSACDSGLINVATNIFRQMDKLPESDKLVTVYCLTIIMAGFIESRELPKAKGVLDEMIQRGIEPSSISVATLLKSRGLYSLNKNPDTLTLAEEFVKSLSPKDAEWNKPCKDRRTALEHVYVPLLSAYCREKRLEDVERLYQDILDAGGQPTLGILALLLDSYRRAAKPEFALQLWPQIVQLGLEYSESTRGIEDMPKSDSHRSSLKNCLLCIPLSIYVDAMSAAGYHTEVVKAWEEYKAQGFGYDSHNWNHLVIALIRAGKIEHAFEAMENVILPYWSQWQSPQDMLVKEIERLERLDDSGADADELSELSSDAATGVSEAERRSRAKRKVASSVMELARLNPEIATTLFGGDDVVRPLRLLQHIAPNWNIWRPHSTVLRMMTMVLIRLESGYTINPIGSNDIDDDWDDMDSEATRARQREARSQLERICRNYPQTTQMITAYETVTRRKLGDKEYNERYSWT